MQVNDISNVNSYSYSYIKQQADGIKKRVEAKLLILLGDIPIKQFLCRVSDIKYGSLQEYVDLYGYGTITEAVVSGKKIRILPLAHPRQIGALGSYSRKWHNAHKEYEEKIKTRR